MPDLQSDVIHEFGYHPDTRSASSVIADDQPSRVLVVGAPVGTLMDLASSCRVLWDAGVDLPEGVYWFRGLPDGDLILQMCEGALPSDMVTAPVGSMSDDSPLHQAWLWAEHLWAKATEIPAPKYRIHDLVLMAPEKVDVNVVDRRFVQDRWTYTVHFDGARRDISESALSPCPISDDPAVWVAEEPTSAHRFSATLTRAKLQGQFADTLFSFRATRTTFRPYQFKPVLKLLQAGKARLLIADEVGLGKTIEAGLIWTELEARQQADRVLIVSPASLVEKWRAEMGDRFGFDVTELTIKGLDEFRVRHLQNRLPPRHAYVCSIERLRTWQGLDELRDAQPNFDLIIVDEAHVMRNQDTRSYALGTQLAEWATNLVFLSATPINLGQQDLLSLLELLAPEDFGDLEDLELRLEPNRHINRAIAMLRESNPDKVAIRGELDAVGSTTYGVALAHRPEVDTIQEILNRPQLSNRDIVELKRQFADLNTLSAVITRTKKVEVDDRKARRTELRAPVQWTPQESRFYSEYLAWCHQRARAANSTLYFAMQMPLRLASACLPVARGEVLQWGREDGDLDSANRSGSVPPQPELVQAANVLVDGEDSKFDQLSIQLAKLHADSKQALLFTFSRPTLSYLKRRLGDRYRIALLHGGIASEQRLRIMADFRDGLYDFVFANRVASEGLDFEFCSAVINYDLPWNPMEIEQRIGRIDRIGQIEENILVINFINEETIDERILARLIDRIDIFESSIGALEPIITAHAPTVLQAGLDFSLTPEQRDAKVRVAMIALEQQQANLEEVSDAANSLLVIDDVDISGLESDVTATGRYVGQRELALLLRNWAHADGGVGLHISDDGTSAEFRGNAAMSRRVSALANNARRSRIEIESLAALLRNEMTIPLVLDQEQARTKGGTLLSATNPLVIAATTVPEHRQARFASLTLPPNSEGATPGDYVVVLARAVGASRGGDEIWGAAVDMNGRSAGRAPSDALLAALAQGALADAPLPDSPHLPALATRALNALFLRHDTEEELRQHQFRARQQGRLTTVAEQNARKIRAIERRIATSRANARDGRVVALFESQKVKAEQGFARLREDLAAEDPPHISIEPLAACVVYIPEER